MSTTMKIVKRKDSRIPLEAPSKDMCSKCYPPDNPDTIPFREFIDADINAEKWDLSGITTQGSSSEKKASTTTFELFKDPYEVHLPPSVIGNQWKKIDEIFPDASFVIKSETVDCPNLMSTSKHLLHSQFVRSFISSIEILYYLSNYKKFEMEFTSSSFSPSFEKDAWRPWHHIYSNCKSGKNVPHNPTPNHTGKYIVRLFWLGSWKKIYINDFIPMNQQDEILLPSCIIPPPSKPPLEKIISSTISNKEKKGKEKDEASDKSKGKGKKDRTDKRTIEIWPFLLSKALMILASLTWTRENELVDFDIIQCLTGWIPNKLYLRTLDYSTIWKICMDHTTQYTWAEPSVLDKSGKKGKGGSGKESKKGAKSSKTDESNKSDKGSKSDKTSNRSDKSGKDKYTDMKGKSDTLKKPTFQRRPRPIDEDIDKNNFIVTVGIEFEGFQDTEEPRIWNHSFLVSQTRTVTLLKPSTDEEYEPWKRYRWIDWAINRKLINPRAPPHPIKSFHAVDPFRDKYFFMIPEKSVMELDSPTEMEAAATNKIHQPKKPKAKKGKPVVMFKDTTFWLDYEDVYKSLKYLIIYHKASSYKVKTRVSNLSSDNLKKEAKYPFFFKLDQLHGLEWKEIIYPGKVQEHRNEPLYLFCDSLFKQTIVINLSQTGYVNVLNEEIDILEMPVETKSSECGICATTFLERVKKNLAKISARIEECDTHKKVALHTDHYIPEASMILSKFKWYSDTVNDFVIGFSTRGSTSYVLNLKPGRHVMSIWIQTEVPYCVQFYSNTLLCIGNLEEILTLMGNDSLQFRNAYCNLIEDFQYLINSFGTSEYLTALRNFYKSFKPFHPLPTNALLYLNNIFERELFAFISETLGASALQAMKILLMKWQFAKKPRLDTQDSSIFCYGYEEEDKKFVEIMHQRAIKIQAFFRGVYERILMNHHNPRSSNHAKTAEVLYEIFEASESRDKLMGAQILQRFSESIAMIPFSYQYSWYYDMFQQIWLAQFAHTFDVLQPGWTFISRQVFFVRPGPALCLRIHMFCDIDDYILRVFDNDTYKEMPFHVNNVTVNEYIPNCNGYTLVAYGRSETTGTYNYKVIYACEQKYIQESLQFSHMEHRKLEITDYYVPNLANSIQRYILSVKSDLPVITIHFQASFAMVKMKLQVYPQSNPTNVLIEATGLGSVTIPCILLHDLKGINYLEQRRISKNEYQKSVDSGSLKKSPKRITSNSGKQTHQRQSKVKARTSTSKESSVKLPSFMASKRVASILLADADPGVYVIDATVLDDSWPLTDEEWKRSEEERERRLNIGPLVEADLSSRSSIKGVESIQRKRSESSIKGGPCTTIKVYYTYTDELSLTRWTEKEDYMRKMKISWYENDPGRYETARALRQDFIDNNKIFNEQRWTDQGARSLIQEVFKEEIIPPLDFTPYLTKPYNEVQIRTVKSEEDINKDIQDILMRVSDYNFDLVGEEEGMKKFIAQETDDLEAFNNWFEDIQDDSRWMMDEVNIERQKYLDMVRQLVNPKKPKKGGKEKKKK